MPTTRDILGIIMGGGRGSRLYPLTRDRSKPAVPIAGKYRLIDIPISNCINSNINRIAVLTQFNSVSLHRHISRTFVFDSFHRGWVQIWAAEQTPRSDAWYQGTADAVRKQLLEIRSTGSPYVLILAGDHLYRMDFGPMADFHWDSNADITIAVQPVPADQAFRFGILKRNLDGRLTDFIEKPKDSSLLREFISRDDLHKPYIGSMGNYLFKTEVLIDLLESSTDDDFGGEVIPNALGTYRVFGYDFDGFWEDIGTIRSFYETNLMLARPMPPFNLNDPQHPIFTRPRYLPGSIFAGASLHNVLLADGCYIQHAEIEDAIIGLRSQIADGVHIKESILMGTDYYEPLDQSSESGVPLGIGRDCHIEGAILDKNARLGEGVVIRPFPPGSEVDEHDYIVRDGIVVIPKNTTLPTGTCIAPK